MQCPSCSLYHPSRYDTCVSCGTKLVADGALLPPSALEQTTQQAPRQTRQQRQQEENATGGGAQPARGGGDDDRPRKGLPVGIGIAIAGFILCVSAGGTFFFLTKPPENERLYQEGQKQLQLGQFAFAVKTLNEAVKARPNDGKALLALARAYVGVDQVDKAWECITQAQQLGGAGVAAEPELASDLANYYRQRNKYDKAVDLLRPLAQANIAGKKAELADLDAAWGDECVREGNFRQAMRCWEEVKELHEGTRFGEADNRLSTVYQKIADEMMVKGDSEEALKYYTKLNVQTPSATSFERTADLYDKQGKLELAIDQLRRAIKLSSDNPILTHKLSVLMVKRGKEMLDQGDADSGYGYLQQAQSLDPRQKAPPATVRSMHMDIDAPGGSVHVSGEVWNPGQELLNALTLRAELFDTKLQKAIWTKDHHVIDAFVPPLASRDSRPFDLTATANFDPAVTDLRLFLNGALYKTYPLGKRSNTPKHPTTLPAIDTGTGDAPITLRPRIAPTTDITNTTPNGSPTPAPHTVNSDNPTPPVAPVQPVQPVIPQTNPGGSAEEKTLKDLD